MLNSLNFLISLRWQIRQILLYMHSKSLKQCFLYQLNFLYTTWWGSISLSLYFPLVNIYILIQWSLNFWRNEPNFKRKRISIYKQIHLFFESDAFYCVYISKSIRAGFYASFSGSGCLFYSKLWQPQKK